MAAYNMNACQLVLEFVECAAQIAAWQVDYNTNRPHSSLEYGTPAEFAQQLAASPSTLLSNAWPNSLQGQALRAPPAALSRARRCENPNYQEGEAENHAAYVV
jgi:Integrase core domain